MKEPTTTDRHCPALTGAAPRQPCRAVRVPPSASARTAGAEAWCRLYRIRALRTTLAASTGSLMMGHCQIEVRWYTKPHTGGRPRRSRAPSRGAMARLYFLRLCLVSPGLALLLCTCCARLGVATSGGPAALVPPSRAAYELAAAALSFPTARVSRQAERAALADMPGLPVGQEGQREAPAACTSLSGPRCLAAGGSTWAHRDAGGADDANGEQGVGEHVFKVYSTGGR